MTLTKVPSRHPVVPFRRLALSEERAAEQVQRGIFTVHRGERFAIPVDDVGQLRDFRRGVFVPQPTLTFLNREVWRRDGAGRVFRPGARMTAPGSSLQGRALAWLRDHVNPNVPYWYYMATLGHDLHVSTWGNLFGRQWHPGWANPFEPDRLEGALDGTFETFFATHFADVHACRLGEGCPAALMSEAAWRAQLGGLRGFVEDLGWLSGAKVTDAFISEEIDELVSTTGTEFADFDYHEVGTSTQVESNDDTALITTSGIARATGSPTDADPIYRSVGTITADATESWEEHGLFNNSTGAALMDRSLTGGQSVDSGNQVQYTYEITHNPEA